MRTGVNNRTKLPSLGYEIYKGKKNPVYKKAMFVSIVNEYLKFAQEFLLNNGRWDLPDRMGYIEIYGKNWNIRKKDGSIKRAVDFKETMKLRRENPEAEKNKEVVYLFNEHTNGIRYKIEWMKNGCLMTQKEYYKFKPVRELKRNLAKRLKNNIGEYIIRNKKTE
jgi:hypothetical protein